MDRAKDLKEQTWDRLPEEGQDLAKEATKEGAGKAWEKVKQSKTLGKAAKRAEKAVKPLAKKATRFVAKKANPVVGAITAPGTMSAPSSRGSSPRRRACGSGNGSRKTSFIP